MPYCKITRRRRITVLKFFLIGFAVLGVIFWFNQVHNVPSEIRLKNDFGELSSEALKRNNRVNKNSVFNSKFPNVENIIPIHGEKKTGRVKILPQVSTPILDHKAKRYENKAIKDNRQIVPPFNIVSKSVHQSPKDEVYWNKVSFNYSNNFMKITPGLGENGAPVHLPYEEQKVAEEEFSSAAFNVYISDRIALNRSVPDPRNPMCKHVNYDYDLPKASVIIIFTNEMWSALLRTIITVVNRTPTHLLKEIILVDDFSDAEHLKSRLDAYISHSFESHLIKIIRLTERQGLVRARLAGAKSAVGDVLVFLDSHCEANIKWLEPLLQRIKENRKAVLCPIIDVIDDKTLEYYASNLEYFQIGGFTWSGHFTWIEIPEWEEKRRGSPISPTRTPTMAGGLFAIDRQYFWEMGSYDAGMDIWGGENLEMSFRVWMCGGALEIVPCSHVGHIFRSFHPYAFPGNKDTHGINTVRTVEVWMEDYKKYFYMYRPDLGHIDYGDISDRINLRKKLHCKSFSWYLETVYPQKFVLDQNVMAYGIVRNPISNLCLDTLNKDEDKTEPIGLYPCKNQKGVVMNQMLSLTEEGELRKEDNCAEVTAEYSKQWLPVMMAKCHGKKENQEWTHVKGGAIVHSLTGKCLDATLGKPGSDAYVTDCRGGHYQVWWFENYLDMQLQIVHQQ